jgi:GGDEF domain-containing protein
VHGTGRERVGTAVQRFVPGGRPNWSFTFAMRIGGTGWSDVDATIVDLLDDPHVHGLVVTLRPTSIEHSRPLTPDRPAARDRLTGLAGRTMIIASIRDALEDPASDPAQCVLLFADLDRLTAVNDAFGQAVGDHGLRLVADRLATMVACTPSRRR